MEFTLFDRKISFTDEQDSYFDIYNAYDYYAEIQMKKFNDIFKTYSNMEDVSEKALDDGNHLISEIIDKTIKDFVKDGIVDVDYDTFVERYYSQYYSYGEYYEKINDKYMDIILSEEEKDEYRRQRRENRSRWQGGGFGLGAAISGAAKAGALNMASGAMHMAGNAVAKGFSAIGAGIKKNELFHDENTLNELLRGIYISIFSMHYAVVEVYKNKNFKMCVYSNEEKNKEKAMLNNLENIQDDEKKKDLYVNVINTYPLDKKIYSSLLSSELDRDFQFAELVKYLQIDIGDDIDNYLRKTINFDTIKSEEEAIEIKNKIEHMCDLFGVSDLIAKEVIDKVLNEFDIKARTFKDILYDTRENRVIAEKQDKDCISIVGDLGKHNVNEIQAILKVLENKRYFLSVTKPYSDKLVKQRSELEKKSLEEKYGDIVLENLKLQELIEKRENVKKETIFTDGLKESFIDKVKEAVNKRECSDLDDIVEKVKDKSYKEMKETINQINTGTYSVNNKATYAEKIKKLKKRKAYEDFCMLHGQIDVMNLEEGNTAKQLVNEDTEYDTEDKKEYVEEIEQHIHEIQVNNDYEVFNTKYFSTDIFDNNAVNTLKDFINKNIQTDERKNMLNVLNNLKDDKIRNAKLCQNRKQRKFVLRWLFEIIIGGILLFLKFADVDGIVSTNILLIVLIVVVIGKGLYHLLQESDWDSLTIKGKSIHPEFMKKAKIKFSFETIIHMIEILIIVITCMSFIS